MQFNGIESGHGTEMHHVTDCMHDYSHYDKKEGAGGMSRLNADSQAFKASDAQAEGQLSLSAWLDRYLNKGKRLLRSIWGSSEATTPGAAAEKEGGKAEVIARSEAAAEAGAAAMNAAAGHERQDTSVNTPQIAAASTAIPQDMRGNPYFAAVQDGGSRQETLREKMKVKFRDVAGKLSGRLPGKFFQSRAKGSFQAKQEQRPKEDLRKHSRFRRDEVEIDCILTDDSYLLDSYDRKGGYSKLSVENSNKTSGKAADVD